jgi:hypothetical protein
LLLGEASVDAAVEGLRPIIEVEPWGRAFVGVALVQLGLGWLREERGLAPLRSVAEGLGLDSLPMLEALVALPEELRPYARLSAPERKLVREGLERVGATELLARLPVEDPPA